MIHLFCQVPVLPLPLTYEVPCEACLAKQICLHDETEVWTSVLPSVTWQRAEWELKPCGFNPTAPALPIPHMCHSGVFQTTQPKCLTVPWSSVFRCRGQHKLLHLKPRHEKRTPSCSADLRLSRHSSQGAYSKLLQELAPSVHSYQWASLSSLKMAIISL